MSLITKTESVHRSPFLSSEKVDQKKLDGSLVRGLAWTGGGKWLTQLIAWASTIVIAKLLTPQDYGVVTLAMVYLGLITNISQFGVDSAIITLRELTEDQIAQLNALSVIMGLFGLGLSFLLSRPLGLFFKSAQLPAVLVIMSFGFVISSFQVVPGALLQRDLKFKLLSVVDGVRAVTLAVATVSMAALGFGYWSLVYGAVLSSLISTSLIVVREPASFRFPQLRSLSAVLRFSWSVLISRLCWYGYSNADFVIAGRILGQTALGGYGLAWNLANVPIEKVSVLVGQVTPSFFSATQKDPAALRRYLLRITELLAIITFPMTVGMAFTARPLVLGVLGAKWSGAIAALELLAVYASIRSIATLLSQVLISIRQASFTMWINLFALVLMPTCFYIGSHWGITGIAAGWILGYPLVAFLIYQRVFSSIQMSARDYLHAIEPAITGTLIMVAALSIYRYFGERGAPSLTHLMQEICIGVVAYMASLLLIYRDRVASYQQAFLHLRSESTQVSL